MSDNAVVSPVLLPLHVKPVFYDILLDLDLVQFSFKGEETIELDITEETKSITLHCRYIEVKQGSIQFASKGEDEQTIFEDAISINFDLKLHTVTFGFESVIPVGSAFLSIEFIGEINNQMAGLYRSRYNDADGEQRIMASTQFESLDARRCFPCFDEPQAKAVFKIALVIDSNLSAIGNMPIEAINTFPKKRKLVKFQASPKMSSYLVAFCVGELDMISGTTTNGVCVSVYTPPGRSKDGEFSLSAAIRALDYYDEYFDIKYPLPKLDMVAINEFAMGAMENWGLVTYREADLLLDLEKCSSAQMQRVCIVVTHELAHQWFGNLVTFTWWSDLWLNEGFASWMENAAADYLFPSWDIWPQVTIDAQASALRLDALRSSHPIQVPIAHAEEVEEVFDIISYNKGSFVVRMAHAVLGHEDFQKGLRKYLADFAYSNATTQDLWNAWEVQSGKPIAKLMSKWTEQTGYPLIIVDKVAVKNGNCVLQLTQERFLADGSYTEADNVLWTVPLILKTHGGEKKLELFDTKSFEIQCPVENESDWICLNYGQEVPLRILYTENMLVSLSKGIKNKTLLAENRASVLFDTYSCAKIGKISMSSVMTLLQAYADEDSYIVWATIVDVLNGLGHHLQYVSNDVYESFKEFAGKMIKKIYDDIGWETTSADGHLTKMCRSVVISLVCKYPGLNLESVKNTTHQLFETGDVSEDYKVHLYRFILSTGTRAHFDKMMAEYHAADSAIRQKYVLNSLGSVPDDDLRREVLEWSISGKVKLQDFFYVFISMGSAGKAQQRFVWDFFKANFDSIHNMLKTASPSLMDATITGACRNFCTNEDAQDILDFFQKNPLPLSQRKISQLVEGIQNNAKVVEIMKNSEVADVSFWSKF